MQHGAAWSHNSVQLDPRAIGRQCLAWLSVWLLPAVVVMDTTHYQTGGRSEQFFVTSKYKCFKVGLESRGVWVRKKLLARITWGVMKKYLVPWRKLQWRKITLLAGQSCLLDMSNVFSYLTCPSTARFVSSILFIADNSVIIGWS
jgi:hypothetical protein